MGGGKGNTRFLNFPSIEAGIEGTAAVAARNLQRGGGTFAGLADKYSPPVDPKRAGHIPMIRTGRIGNGPAMFQDLPHSSLSAVLILAACKMQCQAILISSRKPWPLRIPLVSTAALPLTSTLADWVSRRAIPMNSFVPQSLDGAVQMQNATQPQHNPLSFQ